MILKIGKNLFKIKIFFFVLLFFLHHPQRSFAGDIEKAVKAYRQGYSLFFEKHYSDALEKFLASQRYLPKDSRYNRARDNLYYFIGLCYYKLGQNEAAYVNLKRYVFSKYRVPRKERRAQKIIDKIQAKILPSRQSHYVPRKTVERRRQVVPPPSSPPPAKKFSTSHLTGFIVLGTGIVTLAVASLTGLLAKNKFDEVQKYYENLKDQPQREAQLISKPFLESQSQGTLANVLFIVGGATTLTGGALLLFWKQPHKSEKKP